VNSILVCCFARAGHEERKKEKKKNTPRDTGSTLDRFLDNQDFGAGIKPFYSSIGPPFDGGKERRREKRGGGRGKDIATWLSVVLVALGLTARCPDHSKKKKKKGEIGREADPARVLSVVKGSRWTLS